MIQKALDLLRTLGWLLLKFVFDLIDSLYDILKTLNSFDIIDSIAKNGIFKNFHSGVLVIALTLLGLFALWRFVMKMLDPDEGMSPMQIIKEIVKCTLLVLLSTFLFAQASTFSIKLSGYTANALTPKNMTIGENMISMYVDYSDGYKKNDDFEEKDFKKMIANGKFTDKSMYNDTYITDWDSEDPNEERYQYSINWIMALIVGAFFLYAIFFSGMMLAKRQIEFLFLFIISPVVFATSIGNKQRRGAVIEQLISLMLQGAVIMLIIALTSLVMGEINSTTFFVDSVVKDVLLKSLLFLGCASFLLTGSQVANKFIGNNVSANSGREQMMAMMGFGQAMSGVGQVGTMAAAGVSAMGLGAGASAIGKVGGNKVMEKLGGAIEKFGNNVKNYTNNKKMSPISTGIGNTIEKFGSKVRNSTPTNVGKNLRNFGRNSMGSAMNKVNPYRNSYRKRYGGKDD